MTQTDAHGAGNGQPSKPITRADIEAKLDQIKTVVDEPAREAKNMSLAIGVTVVAVVVIGAFLIGRRRGRRRRGIIVIRQV